MVKPIHHIRGCQNKRKTDHKYLVGSSGHIARWHAAQIYFRTKDSWNVAHLQMEVEKRYQGHRGPFGRYKDLRHPNVDTLGKRRTTA